MKLLFTYWVMGGLLYWASAHSALAQTPTQSTSAFCGITELTPQQAIALTKKANLALQKKRALRLATSGITYVPIRPHILRRTNGSGGFSLARMNQVMALTNSYFLLNDSGIQFYFAGDTPDYIDNDYLYNNNTLYPDGNATNAMNQYYVPFISQTEGGYAYYPNDDNIITTRSVIAVGGSDEDIGNRIMPHELGHSFNLVHTYGNNNGSGMSTELVTRGAGANCSTDGDLVCDTPADPYHIPGANLITINGCPQYDPTSTARDENGQLYAPSITNIMSYYYPCTHDFTAGQLERMQAGLALRQTHTSYTLNAPPTAVTSPTKLSGTSNGATVVLTWQDNADNEMGYFIERSTSATSGFLPIGGVAPDVTTFTDARIVAQTQYYYRIRPSNTTTGSLSSTFVIAVPTAPLVTGLSTTNITENSAQLNWNSTGIGSAYALHWRAVGASVWNTVTSLTTTAYSLAALAINTAYEWEVKVASGNTYVGPINFTTNCPVPASPFAYPFRTTANLSWSSSNPETFTIQWRPQGTSNWNSIPGLASTFYSLTGLTASTAYDWQVQATCSGSVSVSTAFTNPQSFTTQACPAVSFAYLTYAYATSASLSWSTPFFESTTTYTFRYRIVGETNWTTLPGITSNVYSLTGLANNTTYEWQVQSVCAPTESSTFSAPTTFTTQCDTPINLTSIPTASGATLNWSFTHYPETEATLDVQYRVVGTTTWTTLSTGGLTYTYSLAGLQANTTYEWRLRTVCAATAQSDYSPVSTFTTSCWAPTGLYINANQLTSTSAEIDWYLTADPGTPLDIRYRPVGAPDWTTISSVTATLPFGNYLLTNLTNTTQYEWQVRAVCSVTESSTFTSGPAFTTQCQIPANLSNIAYITSAQLSWLSTGIGTSYDVRYRRSDVAEWTTLTNLTATTVYITDLLASVLYEWQVRTHCSDGQYSDFSVTKTFGTPPCTTPINASTSNLMATSAQLNWYFPYADAATRYEVRYRAVGAPDWITLTNLATNTTQSTTVLTGLTVGVLYQWEVRVICTSNNISLFSSSIYFSTCPGMYTLKAGSWTDASVWSCNRIPASGDIVQIKHQITVPINYTANALSIRFDAGQQLSFGQNAKVKVGL